jgi:hypothetical protein
MPMYRLAADRSVWSRFWIRDDRSNHSSSFSQSRTSAFTVVLYTSSAPNCSTCAFRNISSRLVVHTEAPVPEKS